jgi:hypothetical protein
MIFSHSIGGRREFSQARLLIIGSPQWLNLVRGHEKDGERINDADEAWGEKTEKAASDDGP